MVIDNNYTKEGFLANIFNPKVAVTFLFFTLIYIQQHIAFTLEFGMVFLLYVII